MKWLSFFKVIIFFGRRGISILSLSTIPWAFYILSLNYFFLSVEHIRHDYKVESSNLFSHLVFLYKFM